MCSLSNSCVVNQISQVILPCNYTFFWTFLSDTVRALEGVNMNLFQCVRHCGLNHLNAVQSVTSWERSQYSETIENCQRRLGIFRGLGQRCLVVLRQKLTKHRPIRLAALSKRSTRVTAIFYCTQRTRFLNLQRTSK